MGGDFNKRNIERELRCYPDIKLQKTPPTRGNNTLDLIFTNFDEYIVRAGVTDPVFSQAGTESDHLTVYVNAKVPRVPSYNVESYTYIKQTEEGDRELESYLRSVDWNKIKEDHPDTMVQTLHEIFENGMKKYYETRKSVKKSSEPPWMTAGIHRLIRRRRAVFRKWGRNAVWKSLKIKTKKIISERKLGYNVQKKEKILAGTSTKFHDCVRAFINNDKKKDWSPRQLYPDKNEK